MYRLFEISVISIMQAAFVVNVGTVVRARVKFVGFPVCSEEFFLISHFALSFSSKTEGCVVHLHNEISGLLPFCVFEVAKCRSCSNYNQNPNQTL